MCMGSMMSLFLAFNMHRCTATRRRSATHHDASILSRLSHESTWYYALYMANMMVDMNKENSYANVVY
jgi:hypothetical protein